MRRAPELAQAGAPEIETGVQLCKSGLGNTEVQLGLRLTDGYREMYCRVAGWCNLRSMDAGNPRIGEAVVVSRTRGRT